MSTSDAPRRGPRSLPPWPLLVLALVIVYVVWGSTYLGIRVTVEEADPMTAMGQRYTVAGLVLAALLALRHGPGRLRLTRHQVAGTALLGLMLPLLGNGVVALGESLGVTSGYAALLIAVAPLAIVVFRTLEHDRPRAMTLVGVCTGFAGLAVLVLLGRGHAGGVPVGPALLVLGAGTCWALGSYLQPRLWLPEDPFVIAVYEMFFGGLLLNAAGLATGQSWTLHYESRTWFALGYLVVFGSVVAFSAYVWLVANAPISLVATYAYVNPVIAVLLGHLVLGEHVTPVVLVGGGIVVGSVAVVITAEALTPSG
jgi:drug/metabolite transporter (DMT)-like permease